MRTVFVINVRFSWASDGNWKRKLLGLFSFSAFRTGSEKLWFEVMSYGFEPINTSNHYQMRLILSEWVKKFINNWIKTVSSFFFKNTINYDQSDVAIPGYALFAFSHRYEPSVFLSRSVFLKMSQKYWFLSLNYWLNYELIDDHQIWEISITRYTWTKSTTLALIQ